MANSPLVISRTGLFLVCCLLTLSNPSVMVIGIEVEISSLFIRYGGLQLCDEMSDLSNECARTCNRCECMHNELPCGV